MSAEPGRITGVGGVFRRARDPDALRAFYAERLGLPLEDGTGMPRDGVVVEDGIGRFAWVTDPEGNRVELWEPAGEASPG